MQKENILSFDDKGNLVPYGETSIDLEFFYSFFVSGFPDSDSRREIFRNYVRYVQDLSVLLETDSFVQYIAGSFTTNKKTPSDIDIINLVNFYYLYKAGEEKRKILFNNFIRRHEIGDMKIQGKSRELYNVDAFLIPIFPQKDPRFESESLKRIKIWQQEFGSDNDGNPKGVVKIIFDKEMMQKLNILKQNIK